MFFRPAIRYALLFPPGESVCALGPILWIHPPMNTPIQRLTSSSSGDFLARESSDQNEEWEAEEESDLVMSAT